MSRLKEIAEGWGNHFFSNDATVKVISEERMKICNDCEFISTKHKTIRPDVHCTKCSCTLAAKTKSLTSACPLGKWTIIGNNE